MQDSVRTGYADVTIVEKKVDKVPWHLGEVSLVYITKTPTATATPFLARILRVRQKDPGFRGFRPTRSRLAQRRKRPPDHARDSFGISQKVRLPDRALERRWSQSTQRDHIALARSQCHGTSFRPRPTMTSSPRCHVTKICVNAAAPRC